MAINKEFAKAGDSNCFCYFFNEKTVVSHMEKSEKDGLKREKGKLVLHGNEFCIFRQHLTYIFIKSFIMRSLQVKRPL